MITVKNILVATDFSESGHAALGAGQALAETFGASLHVLHVIIGSLRETWAGFY